MTTRPWLDAYPDIEPEIAIPYANLLELFEYSLSKYAANPAITNFGKSISFSELDRRSLCFADYLQHELGLAKGDRVAIMMPNLIQYPIAILGILRAGLVAVNVNPLYTSRELKHQLKDSDARAIIILENFATTFIEIASEVNTEHVIITTVGDELDMLKGALVNAVCRYVKKVVPKYSLPGAIKWHSTLKKGKSERYKRPDIIKDDPAFLQYTGGTTGVSKGAILTHENILANTLQIDAWFCAYVPKNRDIMITPLPLYHIFALTVNFFTILYRGGQNVLITNPRDFPAFIKELKKWRFNALTGVNTLFNALLHTPGFESVDFSSSQVVLAGGMAVQRSVAEKWNKVTGTVLIEGYGLTEASPVISCNPLNITGYTGEIGLPLPSTDMRIVDEQGKEVAKGEAGELCCRGPQVMAGYWQRPEDSEKALKEGWLHTGDIAVMLDGGTFKIVDRKKDMIIVSGFNVYPNEVEDVAALHEKVLECAAISTPSEKSGEAVKLVVVAKDKSLTSEELIQFCREHLTGYKVPKVVKFVDELPKTNVGKILRRALRE
jgi:long-chain acyl-CoA synthetase|tara:strand:+ start:8580 stop:10232 length:1653 start_codon:yes stop_codon:yes gene_type:complete